MISPLFVCHGGPSLVIEDNEYTRFLKDLGKNIKPKVIVIFTAHFEEDITTISAVDGTYEMIYDFYGFPEELYSVRYPAKGSTAIASRISDMLKKNNIESKLDTKRGLDHGSWSMLQLMYPKADIPVVQMSVNPNLPMEEQYKVGEAIRELCREDILVIGSGATVHNLLTINWEAVKPEAWAAEFDDWLVEKVANKELQNLYSFSQLAPHAKMAVPREEHIVPLFIAMGSASEENLPKLLHRSYDYGTLSYICFQF
ncbi:MAG: class III extradiol ring-cleavage dioxygenase [Bacillota bacterium]|nr:class III extradiol ring-cleavage dioxygenase [Bacillota bacterium]